MSLRSRVLVAIALVLTINAVLGAALAGVRAHAALRSELQAAMQGAGRSVREALSRAPRQGLADPDLRRLVSTFDGDRHVQAVLLGSDGRPVMASRPFLSPNPAPGWFAALVDPKLEPVRAGPAGGQGAITLRPAPEADLSVSWLSFRDLMTVLLLACLSGCGLVYLLIGQALRPLDELVASFGLIGSGNYQIRVAERGASEIASIGRAFNLMATQLSAMRSRNRSLEEQLLKLQDEERADLARDLHDDIGPYLFAVNVDALMISQLASAGRTEEIPAQVKAIQNGVAHMQTRVRDILGRLRPTRAAELGLEPAIRDLVEFWRARCPEIAFEVQAAAAEEGVGDEAREAAYRVVQESLSNAIRHGRPTRVQVSLSAEDGGLVVTVADNGAHDRAEPRREPGYGIIGMRERVAQAGGVLDIDQGRGGGWTVTARLPIERRRRARRRKAAA
jgi:two-component system, NarL family, sensor histidine kinase UhpB